MDNQTERQIESRYPRLWQGLVFFAAVIAAMIVICSPIQWYLGLIGVGLTELILLGMALAAAKFSRCAFADIFPLHLPAPLRMLGIFLMYLGAYLTTIALTSVLAYFFPSLNEVGESISMLGTQLSPAAAVLIMAVLPAVCEESVHRGFILASFKSLKNAGTGGWKALTVASMGVIFGLFHLDPLRFLPTALLGAFFSYVAIESESMVPTVILHLINNLISVVAMYSVSGGSIAETLEEAAADVSLVQLLASCCVYFGLSMLLFFAGWRMFRRVTVRRGVIIVIVVTACILMLAGYFVTLLTTDLSQVQDMFTALEAVFFTRA